MRRWPSRTVTQTSYDALGHTVAVTDALGAVTHSSYDAASHLLQSSDALGNPTSYSYDALSTAPQRWGTELMG